MVIEKRCPYCNGLLEYVKTIYITHYYYCSSCVLQIKIWKNDYEMLLERRKLMDYKYIKCESCKYFSFYGVNGKVVCGKYNSIYQEKYCFKDQKFSAWEPIAGIDCQFCGHINHNVKICEYCGVRIEVIEN